MIAVIKKYKFEILIFLFFVLMRVPSLGHDTFNTDVWKWKARTYDFGSGVFGFEFDKTLQKYHPGVTLMWLGSAGVKVYNLYHEISYGTPPVDNFTYTVFGLHFVQKLFVVLALGFLVSSIFYVLRHLYGARYALLAVLLFSLEPFYVALTRVFHLEGLLSTFMLASLLWFIWYMKYPHKKWRLGISAFLAACAVLTKTSGLFLLPFMGIILYFHEKRPLKKVMTTYLLWLSVFVFCFVLLWPAMWTHPVNVLQTLYHGVFDIGVETDHAQYYFGNLVESPGFSYYFVVMLARATPTLVLGLIATLFVYKKLDDSKKDLARTLIFFGLFYLLIMSIPSKKLDRYIAPTLVSFAMLAALSFDKIIDTLLERWGYARHKIYHLLLVGLVTLPSVISLIVVHPDYFSYYSPLVGGLKRGIYIIEPKWMVGAAEVVSYFEDVKKKGDYENFDETESLDHLLNSTAIEKKLVVGIPEKYFTQIWPFMHEIGVAPIIKDITAMANNSDFIVFPVWADDSASDDRYKLIFVDTINVRGVPVYNVYQRWFVWQWNEMQAAQKSVEMEQ